MTPATRTAQQPQADLLGHADRTRRLELRSFAFEQLDSIAAVIDGSGTVVDTNQAWRLFAQLNGGSPDHTGVGSDYLEVCDRAARAGCEQAAEVAVGLRAILSGDRSNFDLEYPCASATEERWFLLHVAAAPVSDGTGAVVLHVDITSRKQVESHLTARSGVDGLTGLPDRRSLVALLDRKLADPGSTDVPVSVLAVELRGLERVNETYGYQTGDELLARVPTRLGRSVRSNDVVARVSGVGFVVVCEAMSEPEARATAARMLGVMAMPFQIGPHEVAVGLSLGLATGTHGRRAADLLDEARREMRRDETRAGRRRLPGRTRPPPAASGTPPAETSVHSSRTMHGRFGSIPADTMLEAILSHSSDVAIFQAPDGTILWASPTASSVLGTEPDDLIGRNGAEYVHPDDREETLARFAHIIGSGVSDRLEFRILDGSGSVRWVEEVATNLVDKPGVGVIVCNLRDITERRAIEESDRFKARLLAAVGEAIVAIDTSRTVVYWNAAAERTYGWTADEAIGSPIERLLAPAAESRKDTRQLARRIDEGESWSGEFWVRRQDGSALPVRATETPVYDDHGRRIGSIGVSTDISEELAAREIEARLSAIVESSGDAIFSTTLDGVITTWNLGAQELFGYSQDEIIGGHVRLLAPEAQEAEVRDLLHRVRSGESVRHAETERLHSDGSVLTVFLAVSPVRNRAGVVVGASTIAHDVTERVRLRQRAESERAQLADAQRTAHLGSFEVDMLTGAILRSDELCRILGLRESDHSGALLDHVHPDDRQEVLDAIDEVLAGAGHAARTHRILRSDGEVRWVESRATSVHQSRSTILSGTVLDVTERHEAQMALAHQATHDQLTDLPNRAGLKDALGSMLTDRDDDSSHVALALVDLDRFKVINDSFGHGFGDEVLTAAADRVRDAMGEGDIVARFGGDEFMLARCGVADLAGACALAEQAQDALQEPFTIGGRQVSLTASVGVALSESGMSAEALVRDADTAMYQAKEDGRKGIRVFDGAARMRASRRLWLETDLHDALARDELHVEYQPVVALADERVAGLEALVRWNHPELGAVPPSEFVPIAEAGGLIQSIGSWVLETALRQLAEWQLDPAVASDLWMAVNLSAAQIAQPGIVDRVDRAVSDAGLQPQQVHLEVTETMLMDRIEQASATIGELRELGTRISIDDFGTGYSSLSYLEHLTFDTLKIDQSFVRGLGAGGDEVIVRAVTALARSLDLAVVGEGVERPRQAAALRQMGCAYGQGFLWSRPRRAEDVPELLAGRPVLRPIQPRP